MKRIKFFLLTAFVGICALLLSFVPSDNYFAIAKNLDIFTSMFKEVNALYVDEIEPRPFIEEGIDAMLQSLDPYTSYIPEEEMESFRSMTTGLYAGVGAMIGDVDGKVVVTMPYESFPAEKAGIKTGDEIIKIDGVSVTDMNVSEASQLLKGQAETEVTLLVKRYGTPEPITFKFNRKNVKVKNVPYYGMLADNIGYIKLSDFTIGAGREVADAVEELKVEGAEKICLDLRSNPGGLLNEAINVVNVFISKGRTVVETKGKVKEWDKSYKTLNHPIDTAIPLIVLVNSQSASASEIVAGAIQDYDRGILIGRKTFGKGLVQTTRSLSYNSQVKITTAKYYTPSGRCIQSIDYSDKENLPSDSVKRIFYTAEGRQVYDGDGLRPDIKVEPTQMAPVIRELLSSNYIFHYANQWHYENLDEKSYIKSDEEFNKFKQWLKTKEFSYRTDVEGQLNELKQSAEDESYYIYLKEEIASLQNAVDEDKKNDLDKFKDLILELIEQEVASRVDYFSGKVKATFDDDQDILKAKEIFEKENGVDKVLSRS